MSQCPAAGPGRRAAGPRRRAVGGPDASARLGRGGGRDMVWSWRFEKADGTAASSGDVPKEAFGSQGDAESWLGENWRALLGLRRRSGDAPGGEQGRVRADEPASRGLTTPGEGQPAPARLRAGPRHGWAPGRGACGSGPDRCQGRAGGLVVRAGSRSITGPSTSSILRMIPASNWTPEAFTFSLTCSGLVAPMIAADTPGVLQHPGDGELGHAQPGFLGDRVQLRHPAQDRVCQVAPDEAGPARVGRRDPAGTP